LLLQQSLSTFPQHSWGSSHQNTKKKKGKNGEKNTWCSLKMLMNQLSLNIFQQRNLKQWSKGGSGGGAAQLSK